MNKRRISLLLSFLMILSALAPTSFADNTGIYLDPTPYYDDVMEDINGPSKLPIDTLENYRQDDDRDVFEERQEFSYKASEDLKENEPLINNTPYFEGLSELKAKEISASERVTFIVEMEKASLLEKGFDKNEIYMQTASVSNYQDGQIYDLNALENNINRRLSNDPELEIGFNYTVALTGLSVKTKYGNKKAIESLPGVKNVFVAPVYDLPTPVTTNTDKLLQPLVDNATGMIGSTELNQIGYTGKGMRIAILDTGLYENHPNFRPLSDDKLENPLTREEIESVWDNLNASKTTLLPNAYLNTKVPFRFNYSALDYNVDHSYAGHDHGTHVAGIAAANKIDSSPVVGVAPDAQLIVMQVFKPGGGADFAEILAALEDCIHLDVDAANLSLGIANGFTDDNEESNTNKIFSRFEGTGIEVLVASGNDRNNAQQNRIGLNMSPVENPDIGLTGSPSTYKSSLSVASVDNDNRKALYFTVGDKKIGYEDTGDNDHIRFINNFKDQTLDYVIVPGYGEGTDYEGIDVKGKVAVILRGKISFTDKQTTARDKGAIACIVRNNEPGEIRMFINKTEEDIPCIGIFQEDGEYMVEMGDGQLTVGDGSLIDFKNPRTVSSFSSWGVTPDLKLKPEIAGVGGQVYSTTDPQISGSNYATWDGTSMATPQVAGASAILKQYFEKNHPEIKGKELRRTLANVMMSTANIIVDDGVEVSPRSQGSGLVDLVKSAETKAYFTSRDANEGRPKGELGDDPARLGEYTLNFEINNISSDETLNYNLSGVANTEKIFEKDGLKLIANRPYRLNPEIKFYESVEEEAYKYDFNQDGKVNTEDARVLFRYIKGLENLDSSVLERADINKDGKINTEDVRLMLKYFADLPVDVDIMEKISVDKKLVNNVDIAPNSKVKLTAEIKLSQADKAYLSNFPNGIYVEGFIYGNTDNGVNINMPYVGFYGNWSDAPIFDKDKTEDATLHGVELYTAAGTLMGTNPYFREGKAGNEYNSISYSTPLSALVFGQLRGVKKLVLNVTNKETGEEYFSVDGEYMRKSMFNPMFGQIVPTIIENGRDGSKNIWDGLDKEGNELPSGTKVAYNLIGYLDDGDDQIDEIRTIDLTIDSEFPEILNRNRLQDSLRMEDTGRSYLNLEMKDNQYIAAVIFVSPQGNPMGKFEIDNIPGEVIEREFDISGFGNEFTIVIADYAMNETEIDVVLDLGEQNNQVPKPLPMSKDRLYGCETFDRAIVEAGWFSANKEDLSDYRNETFDSQNRYYAGEYVNGYIIAMNAITGNIELVTPGGSYWPTQVLIEQRGKAGENGFNVFYDMALDYSQDKNKLYAIGWAYKGDNNNDGKDDGYNALFEVEFYENGWNNIQEVGRITGVEGEILTLGITTDGKAYGINTKGSLFSINLTPEDREIKCTEIGETDFVNVYNYSGVNVIQSMGYDHNTDTMYWYAHSQTPVDNRYENVNITYKVDLNTGRCTEVGSYGPGGQTSLFVPSDLESNLFTMGVEPTNLFVQPRELIMVEGQKTKLNTSWKPWNAQPTEVKWESTDETIASVDQYGFVTAKSEGNVEIIAKAKIKDYDGTMVDREAKSKIEVVPSEDGLYSFVIQDQKVRNPYLAWVTFSDKDTRNVTEIGKQKIDVQDREGNIIQVDPMWQGGAYYQGYVYTVVKDVFTENNIISEGTSFYRSKVDKADDPRNTIIGQPERVGFIGGTDLINLAFDYNTSRLYAVDGKYGGLGLIDIDTGAYDYLGDFKGDIGGPTIATAMAITEEGTIVIADMHGKLYTVDPDTMETTKIYDENTDYWYYGSMTYDYNTGSIYWNPCMGPNASPFKIIRLGREEWDASKIKADVMDMPALMSKAGTQTTVLFAIPEEEPESRVIPVKDIKITNGDSIKGIEGGELQLTTETIPARPSIRTRTWTSENPEIAEVDKFGKLKFNRPGKTRVTVSITNRDEAIDGGPFTDSIDVEVIGSAGKMEAFLSNDLGATGYYNFWLNMEDNDLGHAEVKESTISIYSILTGVYYDNYYYAYNNDKNLIRIDENDKTSYSIIGRVEDDYGTYPIITGMAMDYAEGICYAVTQDGQFGSIDLNTGKFNFIGNLNNSVFTLAVDQRGKIYGVGSEEYYTNGSLYEIDKQNGSASFISDMPFKAYAGEEYYGTMSYNPQMTYDYTNDRLYINASSYIRDVAEVSYYDGMYVINLDENGPIEEPINIGKIKLQLRGEPKEGRVFLGLMAFKNNPLPETNEEIDGIFMNKEFGRMGVGDEIELEAIIRPSYATNNQLEWSSSDNSVASVEDGIVRGIKPGKARITVNSVADQTKQAVCEITVIEAGEVRTAYSAVLEDDAIYKYNINLPAMGVEKVGTINGKINGMVMIDGMLYYLKYEANQNYLYSYDLTTDKSTPIAPLNSFFELEGLAYDKDEDLLYGIGGFYIFQYDMSKVRQAAGELAPYSGFLMDPSHGTVTSIAAKEGKIYYTVNSFANVPQAIFKTTSMHLEAPETIATLDLNMVQGKCEMAYDEVSGKFYITDLLDNIYYLDENGDLEPIDRVGDNLSIVGIALD